MQAQRQGRLSAPLHPQSMLVARGCWKTQPTCPRASKHDSSSGRRSERRSSGARQLSRCGSNPETVGTPLNSPALAMLNCRYHCSNQMLMCRPTCIMAKPCLCTGGAGGDVLPQHRQRGGGAGALRRGGPPVGVTSPAHPPACSTGAAARRAWPKGLHFRSGMPGNPFC